MRLSLTLPAPQVVTPAAPPPSLPKQLSFGDRLAAGRTTPEPVQGAPNQRALDILNGEVTPDWETHAQDAALKERLEVYKLSVEFMMRLALSTPSTPTLEKY